MGLVFYQTREGTGRVFCSPVENPKAVIIVLHEVWGFTPQIRQTCNRLARHGYTTIAPLLYWQNKVLTLENIEAAMHAVWDLPLDDRYKLTRIQALIGKKHLSEDVEDVLLTLYDRKFRSKLLGHVTVLIESALKENSNVGCVGYSMGGGLAFQSAAEFEALGACITFSAEPPPTKVLRRIKAPMLAFYGTEDEFITGNVPKFVGDALAQRKQLTIKTYPSAGHEFFDAHNRSGYSKESAEDAWNVMIRFLDNAFQR